MMHSYWCRWTEWIDAYMWVFVLTVTVATCCFHQPVVLIIAGHSLIAVALPTVLDVSWNFQSQDTVYTASLRQDAVRPVAHWPSVVLVTGTVLGLAQRIHLGVLAFVFLLTPPWEAKSVKAKRGTDTWSQLYQQHHYYMTANKPIPPINALFLMRTPTQSTVQEENLDQLVSWQSSWQGSWHGCVMLGTALVNSRHSATSACVPLSWRQDRAGRIKGQKQNGTLKEEEQWNLWINERIKNPKWWNGWRGEFLHLSFEVLSHTSPLPQSCSAWATTGPGDTLTIYVFSTCNKTNFFPVWEFETTVSRNIVLIPET